MNPQRTIRRGRQGLAPRQRGFGLVESMIVIVIILFMSIVIFTVLSTSEAHKRTTTSISDADQEGNYAVYVLEKAIRNAGSGFRQGLSASYGCVLNVALNGTQLLPVPVGSTTIPAVFTQLNTDVGGAYEVAPVLIDSGGSPVSPPRGSDALIVMSGTAGFGEYPTNFASAPTIAPTSGTLNLTSTIGFNANDMLLVLQQPAGGLMNACAVTQVAGTASWPVDAKGLPKNQGITPLLPLSGDYYSPGAPTLSFQLANLDTTAQVLNLGNELTDGHPNFQLFAVGNSANGNSDLNDSLNSTLWSYDLLQVKSTTAQNQAVSVANSVYEMYAVYGVSSSTTCTTSCPITSWESPSNANWTISRLMNRSAASNSALYQIKAIRVALVMRTALPEQQTSATSPAVQTTTVTLFNDLLPAGGSATPITRIFNGPNEQNYRYRTIEVTIPIRNNLF